MEETIERLLFCCETSMADNKNEREKILENILIIGTMLSKVFVGNPNLNAAISYFNGIMMAYMNESENEYQFYDKAIKYLNYISEHIELADEDVLLELDDMLDYIEDLFTSRTINTVQVFEHYKSIVSLGILTNSNYYIANLADCVDEGEREKLLSCIPDIKIEDI